MDEKVRSYIAPRGDFDHDAILNDPAWLDIVRAAQSAQERLATMISDASERSALLDPSEHAIEATKRTA